VNNSGSDDYGFGYMVWGLGFRVQGQLYITSPARSIQSRGYYAISHSTICRERVAMSCSSFALCWMVGDLRTPCVCQRQLDELSPAPLTNRSSGETPYGSHRRI